MRTKRNWLIFLLLPLAAAPVWAQGIPTGTLMGRVSGQEGAALPGVSVTAKSPALQGSRAAVTNVNGDYVIPNLRPGDYTIVFSMTGFQNVTRTAMVAASQQILVNAKMIITAVAAETTIVAQSETISQTSQASATYRFETTSKLPLPRTLLASVQLSPGVNQNGPGGIVTVSGGPYYDNNFTVNGVNIQDNVFGAPSNLFIEDAIQETTTMTSGVSAEFGRFTGGVINAVTKSGGNNFSGSFRITLNNDDFQAQPPIPQTYNDETVPTYEVTLGGPIWKDRIWFFGGGRYVKSEVSASTTLTNISFPQTNENERVEGKLTISPFPNHTLTGSYTWTTTEVGNYYFGGLQILDLKQIYDRQTPSDLLAVNYNGVLSSNFFVEGQYSRKTFTFQNSGGRFTDLINGTAVSVQDRNYAMMWSPVFCGVCDPETRDNDDILIKGTWFVSTKGAGSHNIVFGFDDFASQRKANNYQSGSSWFLYSTSVQYVNNDLYPVVDANSYFVYYPIPVLSQGSQIRTYSAFINDTWRLNNNFSFNIGVRYDKNDAKDSVGHQTAKDSAFSPRLSVTYDVRGDGKLRVWGSYARYAGQIQEAVAGSGASSGGAPAYYYYYWTGKEYNTSSTGPFTTTDQILKDMFSAIGVTGTGMFPKIPADYAVLPGVNLQVGDGLNSPHANEYVLGVGGTVGQGFVYRVDAVRREFKDFYTVRRDTGTGTVTDADGNVFDLGYIQNSNVPEREYTGLHTSFAYRGNGLNLFANWTWSHTIGNAGSDITSQLLSYPEYFDAAWFAPRGDLSQDERHRVRLLASYDMNFGGLGVTPGLVYAFDTGVPYGVTGAIDTRPFVKNPGYVKPPPSVTYFFTPRGEYRMDNITRLDLALTLSYHIGPVQLFVQPQVINLFNGQGIAYSRSPTPLNTSIYVGRFPTADSRGLIRFDPFTTTPIECPQAATATECKAMGANWKKSPAFGTATSSASYQQPRTWLVTLGVRF